MLNSSSSEYYILFFESIWDNQGSSLVHFGTDMDSFSKNYFQYLQHEFKEQEQILQRFATVAIFSTPVLGILVLGFLFFFK